MLRKYFNVAIHKYINFICLWMATTQNNILGWVFSIIISVGFLAYGIIIFWVPNPEGICLRYYGASHDALGFFIILISIGMMKGFLNLLLDIEE